MNEYISKYRGGDSYFSFNFYNCILNKISWKGNWITNEHLLLQLLIWICIVYLCLQIDTRLKSLRCLGYSKQLSEWGLKVTHYTWHLSFVWKGVFTRYSFLWLVTNGDCTVLRHANEQDCFFITIFLTFYSLFLSFPLHVFLILSTHLLY